MISGVNQVVLWVGDQLEAKKFWTETMGCRVAVDEPYGEERWLSVLTPDGNTKLVLSKRQEDNPRAEAPDELPHSPVFFYADDLVAAHRELTAKGVRFPTPPIQQPWGWWSVFEDQDGTRYALGQK